MLERDYKRFRSFNKVYWILILILSIISIMASIVIGALAVMGYMDAQAKSDLDLVFYIILMLFGIIALAGIIMIISLATSLPYVIFNGIHLYRFHKANIRFDAHMVFALVMTIILGFSDITMLLSLGSSFINALITSGV